MQNSPRICTPVLGKTLPLFLENLKNVQEISKFIELRFDDIQGVKPTDIQAIRKTIRVPAISTCRPKYQGGYFHGTEKQRIEMLRALCEYDFTYIDIEADVYNDADFKMKNTKLILSAHHLIKMPSEHELGKEIQNMEIFHPEVIKIACDITHEWQNRLLYKQLVNRIEGQPLRVMIGMGERGKMTRILGPLLRAPWTYASTPYGTSAPGQIDLEEMRKIYSLFITF